VFKPVVPRRAGPWREPLRSLADLLGSARDWDVFLEQGLGAIQTELPEYPGLRALQEHGEALRAGSYTALRAALGSPAHTRLLLGLGAWLCARGWRRHLSPSQQAELAAPLVPFAAEVLGQQALGLREQGSEFHSLDAVARHQLRITAKKLRYAGEFFAALFPGAETAPYLAGLSRLQDVLGDLNDADVAGRLLEELGIPPGQPGRCVADGWYACRTHLGRANAEVAWAAFRDLMPFWHPRPD
jgi:CHAD domain-containing protein